MENYIELYHKNFNVERINAVETILTKLKEAKKSNYKFNYISNKIIREGSNYRDNLFINNEPYSILLNKFNNRCSVFEVEHQYKVIPNTLKPEFEKIKTKVKDKELTFVDCISNLAKHEAHFSVYNLFRNNNIIYDFMYRLDKFEGYNNMTKFDVVQYNRTTEGTPIYKELRPQIYPEKKDKDFKTNNETLDNYFQLKKEYYESFLSEDFYNYLTDYFIDDRKTTHRDFKNVFTKHPDMHSSKIYFFCKTTLCSLLLNMLKDECFNNLEFTTVETSKKFFSSNLNSLKQSNISKSKTRCTESEIKTVDHTLNHL